MKVRETRLPITPHNANLAEFQERIINENVLYFNQLDSSL